MPSNANSLVGKTDVQRELHVFSAQVTRRRGGGVYWRNGCPSSVVKKMEPGAWHRMAEGRRVVAEGEGTFQTEWREYRTGLVYEALSLSQRSC